MRSGSGKATMLWDLTGIVTMHAAMPTEFIKRKPLANIFGLHTAYELDRVAGRYHAIEQERSAPRTVYRLKQERSVDLFELRRLESAKWITSYDLG